MKDRLSSPQLQQQQKENLGCGIQYIDTPKNHIFDSMTGGDSRRLLFFFFLIVLKEKKVEQLFKVANLYTSKRDVRADVVGT